jgi:hypothetical protein
MITDVFTENFGSASAARSIYLALTQIASDKHNDTFDASHAVIAHRAGLSVATVRRVLPTFRDLGLITIKRNFVNNIEQPSTYSVIRGAIAHNNERAPAHGERAPAHGTNTK